MCVPPAAPVSVIAHHTHVHTCAPTHAPTCVRFLLLQALEANFDGLRVFLGLAPSAVRAMLLKWPYLLVMGPSG